MLHKWNHSVECFRVRAGFFPLHGCASGIHSCVCMDCGSFIVRVPWEHAATSLPVSESPDTGRLRPRAAVCMLPRGRRRTRLPWVGPWERNGWITVPGPSDFVGKYRAELCPCARAAWTASIVHSPVVAGMWMGPSFCAFRRSCGYGWFHTTILIWIFFLF